MNIANRLNHIANKKAAIPNWIYVDDNASNTVSAKADAAAIITHTIPAISDRPDIAKYIVALRLSI